MRLNNKGQSLVMFVLLIPIFMLILVLIVDVGNIVSLKLDLNNINKLIISYGLDHMDDENLESYLKDLALKNNKDIDDILIEENNSQLDIVLSMYSDSVFGRIVGLDGYEVTSEYKGIINNSKKEIKKVR